MSPFVLIVIIAVVAAFVRGAGRSRRSPGRRGSVIPLLVVAYILANIFSRSAQSVAIDPVALMWLGLAALPIVLVVALLVRMARRRVASEADSLPTPRPPATRRTPAPPPVLRPGPPRGRQPGPSRPTQEPMQRQPDSSRLRSEPTTPRPATSTTGSSPVSPTRRTPAAPASPETPVTQASATRPTSRPTRSLTRRKTASDELVERAKKSLEMQRPTRPPRNDER